MSAPARVLVMTKAPVPGRAKTRLAAELGPVLAARLAAASLIDTLRAARAYAGDTGVVVALDGSVDDAERADDVRAELAGLTVVPQRGGDFAERLVHAHADAGDGPVLQIGMDTPQVTPALLEQCAAGLADHDVVLAPATDGGWWLLGRTSGVQAEPLRHVPMSTPTTGADTRSALEGAGLRVGTGPELRDLDEVGDAVALATQLPVTSDFGTTWAWSR